jgi:glycosyltransferase involved in cell wall biosynthesis
VSLSTVDRRGGADRHQKLVSQLLYGMNDPVPSLILHVIPYLWSGAGGVLTRLCESQRRTHRVAIVTSGERGTNPDWPSYRTRLRRAGVEHHTIDFHQRREFWPSTDRLASLVQKLKPSVVHAHAGVPCCAAAVAREMSGHAAPVIGQMYSWGPDRTAWMNRQDLWGFARTDRVVCSARAYWDLLVKGGVPRRKLTYVPWGLPLERLPFRPKPAGGALTFGFVGRIEARKNQLDLVLAFARLRRHFPDARLELVGPIADRAYARRVRAAIVASDLRRAVTITGEVDHVVSHVRKWDVFVSLSSDEGQGLAVLEAMAIGVPVVARPVAGISDFLVDRQNGFAIRDGEVRTAALAMLRAGKAPDARRAVLRRARAMIERQYDWKRTVDAFERIYRA